MDNRLVDLMRRNNFSRGEMALVEEVEYVSAERIAYMAERSETFITAMDVFSHNNWMNEDWSNVIGAFIESLIETGDFDFSVSEYRTAVLDKCVAYLYENGAAHSRNESHPGVRGQLAQLERPQSRLGGDRFGGGGFNRGGNIGGSRFQQNTMSNQQRPMRSLSEVKRQYEGDVDPRQRSAAERGSRMGQNAGAGMTNRPYGGQSMGQPQRGGGSMSSRPFNGQSMGQPQPQRGAPSVGGRHTARSLSGIQGGMTRGQHPTTDGAYVSGQIKGSDGRPLPRHQQPRYIQERMDEASQPPVEMYEEEAAYEEQYEPEPTPVAPARKAVGEVVLEYPEEEYPYFHKIKPEPMPDCFPESWRDLYEGRVGLRVTRRVSKDIPVEYLRLARFIRGNGEYKTIADVPNEDDVPVDHVLEGKLMSKTQNDHHVVIASNEAEILAATESNCGVVCGIEASLMEIEPEAKEELKAIFGQSADSTDMQLLKGMEALEKYPSAHRMLEDKMVDFTGRTMSLLGRKGFNPATVVRDAIEISENPNSSDHGRAIADNILRVFGHQLRCIANDGLTAKVAFASRHQLLKKGDGVELPDVEGVSYSVDNLVSFTTTRIYTHVPHDLSEVITHRPLLVDKVAAPTLHQLITELHDANATFTEKGLPPATEYIITDVNGIRYLAWASLEAEVGFVPMTVRM